MNEQIKGKDIDFNTINIVFSHNECHYENTGECPIQDLTLQDISNIVDWIKENYPDINVYKDERISRSHQLYCILFAYVWLVEKIKLYDIGICLYENGNKFEVINGRHRLCIANKLNIFDELDIILAK